MTLTIAPSEVDLPRLTSELTQVLAIYYNKAELRVLGQALGLDDVIDDLFAQESPLYSIVAPIISFCAENDRLGALLTLIQARKPILWAKFLEPLLEPKHHYRRHNDHFVGRESEFLTVLKWLTHPEPQSNLIVIRGVNGAGKTRLAQEIARICDTTYDFRLILWLEIRQTTLLYLNHAFRWEDWLKHLNQALKWDVEDSQHGKNGKFDDADYLSKLREESVLLILDGFDELDENEPLLGFLDTLTGTSCKALVTTTQNFISSPYSWALDGWTLPETNQWLTRARVDQRIDALIDQNPTIVNHIYKSTHGLPLAMEWLISQYLQSAIALGDDNRDNALDDQEMLFRIFHRSYAGLSDDARRLLLVASYSAHFFVKDSWTAILGLEDATQANSAIEELLSLLLVKYDEALELYSLQAATRNFVLQILRDDVAADYALRENWITYYLNRVRDDWSDHSRWLLSQHEVQWQELWKVVEYSIEQWLHTEAKPSSANERRKWATRVITFLNVLSNICRKKGYYKEWEVLSIRAAHASRYLGGGEDENTVNHAYVAGWIACSEQRYDEARDWYEWVKHVASTLGQREGYAYRLLARIERRERFYNVALRSVAEEIVDEVYQRISGYLDMAARFFSTERDWKGLARAESERAHLAFDCGKYEAAERHHQAALVRFEEIPDMEGVAETLHSLADVYIKTGAWARARTTLHDALDLAGKHKLTGAVAKVRESFLILAEKLGLEAARLLEEYEAMDATQNNSPLLRTSLEVCRTAFELFTENQEISRADKVRELPRDITRLLLLLESISPTQYDDQLVLLPGDLITLMPNLFTIHELRDLCLALDINHEVIPNDSINNMVRELIRLASRHGRFDELKSAIIAARPQIALLQRTHRK